MMLLLLLGGCLPMDSFFFPAEALEAYAFGYDTVPASLVEEVTFETADGLTLHGVWVHQEDPDAPLLAWFHGNTGNLDHYWDRMEDFWTFGYDAFSFDYRGYGRSGGTPSWSGILEDGRAALAYLRERTGQPTAHLPLLGLSLGAAVALQVAAEETPRVLITEDLFASVQTIIEGSTGGLDLPSGWLMDEPFDNLAVVGDVHAPYLVIHGAEDDYIPPENGELLYAAANDPKALWLVPGMDHSEAARLARDEYQARVASWIAAYPPGQVVEDGG